MRETPAAVEVAGRPQQSSINCQIPPIDFSMIYTIGIVYGARYIVGGFLWRAGKSKLRRAVSALTDSKHQL